MPATAPARSNAYIRASAGARVMPACVAPDRVASVRAYPQARAS
ncbi:hypothetical protein GLA29479_1623 [Lysobacter antibioticus]|uniref:Uncharacterized protein n=1 Tax=Lysobacter antibioticus TaxID=84531 RepID=A0A0S2DVM4_LYSAN|nr:hypothetical protein GLA29479_1623 [Lysobacter antibioticus]ALN80350.1 hypothetical protein LA76x_2211 [Lysobacter antibioticus]